MEQGKITIADYKMLEGYNVKKVSALTNQGITEAFKLLIKECKKDRILNHEQTTNHQRLVEAYM